MVEFPLLWGAKQQSGRICSTSEGASQGPWSPDEGTCCRHTTGLGGQGFGDVINEEAAPSAGAAVAVAPPQAADPIQDMERLLRIWSEDQ